MKFATKIISVMLICIFTILALSPIDFGRSYAEGLLVGGSDEEDAYIKVEPIDVDGVYTREQILDWYGIFDVNELANVAGTEIISDGSVQTINIALADDVYYGGTDGYAEEWLVSDGVISEQFIDLDGDGADEYLVIYIDSTAEDVYDYVYIETAAYAVVFEAEGDYYVYADSMKADIGYTYERFIRIVNGENGTYILQGGIAYWDGGAGGVNAEIFSYDGEKLYMEAIARASTDGSFVLTMRSEPEDAEELMELCDDYYYYTDEAAAAGIVEGVNYFYTDGSYDVFDYESNELNMDCFVGIDNVAPMLRPFGVDVGYTIEDDFNYDLYLNGGENIYYANEEWSNGTCVVVMELAANVDFKGGYRLKPENADEYVIDWSKPYAYLESKGNRDAERGTVLTEDMFGKVLHIQDTVGGWFRFVAPADGDYVFRVYAPNFSGEKFHLVITIDGKTTWHAFTRSDEVQTITVSGIKKGQEIEWWDDDGTNRGYTLLEPFMLMVYADNGDGVYIAEEDGSCKHDSGVYYTEHPDHKEKCVLCDEEMPPRTTNPNVVIAGLSTCGLCFSADGHSQERAIMMAGYSNAAYNMPAGGRNYVNHLEIADVRGNLTLDNTFPCTEVLIVVSETVDHELILTISFEGSQDVIDDWIRDANAIPYDGVHTGVYTAFLRFLTTVVYGDNGVFCINLVTDGVAYDGVSSVSALLNMVKENPKAHLRITGHSYGGALAQYMTVWAIEEFGIPVEQIETYTFGSLVPFTYEFVREHPAVNDARVYNYIHAQDYVPDVGVTAEQDVMDPSEADGIFGSIKYWYNRKNVVMNSINENAANLVVTMEIELYETAEDETQKWLIDIIRDFEVEKYGENYTGPSMLDCLPEDYGNFTSEYKLGGFNISGCNIGRNIYLYSDMPVVIKVKAAHLMPCYTQLLYEEPNPEYVDVLDVIEIYDK